MKNVEIIRRWYQCTLITLISLVAIYLLAHIFIPGAEIIRMSKQEVSDINLILFGTGDQSKIFSGNISTPAIFSKDADSLSPQKDGITVTTRPEAAVPDSSKATDSTRKATVFNYIFSVRRPSCKLDSAVFRNYFSSFNASQFSMVIPNFPIRVKSYFWLTEGNTRPYTETCSRFEGSVYLEIIFWTWFGLISGLLYLVSEALRSGDFNTREIPVHISKFFYSPLISLVIYFSINKLISDGATSLSEFSSGTIVLSFILGFFSGRAIELLNRIKDLVLPLNPEKQPEHTDQTSSVTDEESEIVVDEASAEHKSTVG